MGIHQGVESINECEQESKLAEGIVVSCLAVGQKERGGGRIMDNKTSIPCRYVL